MKLYSDEELAEILDQKIFHQIGEAADRLGVECYVVGGYVRDIFLERPSNDIDVVVVGKPHPLTPSPTGEGEHPRGGKQEERIRQSIALLMEERYGDEPLFNLQGHWQAVYRILVDKGYCRDSDFDGFDAFIRRVMPEEVNKPYKKDSVRNINKTSFNKPFDRWRYDPDDYGTRKPFERMVAIARRFKEILEGNGL